nr:precorrin-3B C(17)-methyltransferase [Pararhodospirillum photometricum]
MSDASAVRGHLWVVGLGPGDLAWRTPEASAALAAADHIVGYETYVQMAGPFRPDQTLHGSDNRVELDRARHAFTLAAQGARVAVVSSGDPGVFAMASAVLEALDGASDPAWHAVELTIVPGLTAAQAAAARVGAPLGHDFCLLSLSDNLKPWEVIENRLVHATAGDFVMAFYNPISKARPWQLGRAFEIVRAHRTGEAVVVLGRDIGRPDERIRLTTLADVRPEDVDMRTVVLIGSSTTRLIPRPEGGEAWVYTPRFYGK